MDEYGHGSADHLRSPEAFARKMMRQNAAIFALHQRLWDTAVQGGRRILKGPKPIWKKKNQLCATVSSSGPLMPEWPCHPLIGAGLVTEGEVLAYEQRRGQRGARRWMR